MCLLDLALGSLYSLGPEGRKGERAKIKRPLYKWTKKKKKLDISLHLYLCTPCWREWRKWLSRFPNLSLHYGCRPKDKTKNPLRSLAWRQPTNKQRRNNNHSKDGQRQPHSRYHHTQTCTETQRWVKGRSKYCDTVLQSLPVHLHRIMVKQSSEAGPCSTKQSKVAGFMVTERIMKETASTQLKRKAESKWYREKKTRWKKLCSLRLMNRRKNTKTTVEQRLYSSQ